MQMMAGGSDDEVSSLVEWVFERTGPGEWRAQLDQVLSIRSRYPGGVWLWTPVVVSEQLLWALPRNGNFADHELPAALAAMCEFLRVADQHPNTDLSERGTDLAEHARTLEAQFVTAMNTKGRWGPNRRMFSAMGVDLTDVVEMADAQKRLNRATRQYNQLSSVERARIGGPTIAPGMKIVGHDYLPLTAAPLAERERQARESRLLQQVSKLAGYVGERVALTAKGNLPLAAGRDLVLLLNTGDEFDPVIGDRAFKTQSTQELRQLMGIVGLAAAAGFIVKRKKVIRASSFAHSAVDDPVAAVSALLKAAVDRGWYNSRDPNIAEFGAFCTEATLLDLYEIRQPMSVADILGGAGQRLRATFDLYRDSSVEYSFINATYEASVLFTLDLMHALGVLTVDPPGSLTARRDALITARIRELRSGDMVGGFPGVESIDAQVSLTSLGLTLIQPWAATHGNAPLEEPVEGDDPAIVLAIAADRNGENAVYELTQWLRDADHAQRVALVHHAIRSQSEVTRSLALRALIGCEDSAASSTLAALTSEGDDVSEGQERLWAWTVIADTERSGHNASEVLDDDRWVTLISEALATLGIGGVQAWLEAETVAARGQRLDRIWRLDRPGVGDVLAAAAERDPDPQNRKQARKSLFKLRQRA